MKFNNEVLNKGNIYYVFSRVHHVATCHRQFHFTLCSKAWNLHPKWNLATSRTRRRTDKIISVLFVNNQLARSKGLKRKNPGFPGFVFVGRCPSVTNWMKLLSSIFNTIFLLIPFFINRGTSAGRRLFSGLYKQTKQQKRKGWDGLAYSPLDSLFSSQRPMAWNHLLYHTLASLPKEQFECEAFGFHQLFLWSKHLH